MDQELYRMQQEAAERVRNMQKRARLYTREDPPRSEEGKTLSPPPPSSPVKPVEKKNELGSLLGALTGDRERLLLLMLAVLLVNNDADMELVLALLYLAM